MKKFKLIVIMILMSSCSGIHYYNSDEFKKNFNISEKIFNKVLEEKVTNKKLKRLKKHFILLNRQLYEENENYYRIDEKIVEEYSRNINYYMMLINDLED